MKTPPQYISDLYYNYHEDPAHRFMRLGQWFINKYFPKDINNDLFFCQDQKKAFQLIANKYYDVEGKYKNL